MKCTYCNHEWIVRKEIHGKQWRCPKCRIVVHDECPECGRFKLISSKYCHKCSCKLIPRIRPNKKGIPTKNGFYIDRKKNSRTAYKMVLCVEHPKTQGKKHYVSEHVLVWEKIHHRFVPKGFIIHHINGDGLDNRPQNLIALKANHHSPWLLYKIACKRIKTLEEQLSQLHLL